jgi:hypothetical protein
LAASTPSRFGSWAATATCSRDRPSSSRSPNGVWAWTTALVTSSLATNMAASATPSRSQRSHTSRTNSRPRRAAMGIGPSTRCSRTRGGRVRALASASADSDRSPHTTPRRGGPGCRPPGAGGRTAPGPCSASPAPNGGWR